MRFLCQAKDLIQLLHLSMISSTHLQCHKLLYHFQYQEVRKYILRKILDLMVLQFHQ